MGLCWQISSANFLKTCKLSNFLADANSLSHTGGVTCQHRESKSGMKITKATCSCALHGIGDREHHQY